MGVIPPLKKVQAMREVTNWKGQNGHKVFIGAVNGKRAKFTVEKNWWKAFVLERLSRSVLNSNPTVNLQLVTKRRGRLTRQEYFSGRVIDPKKEFIPKQLTTIISSVVKLHNSKVPFYLKPFAKYNFLRRVNSSMKRVVWSGAFSESEIKLCERFFNDVPKGTAAICHNDIQTGNIIKQKTGKLVLIDFGDASVGLKEAELGRIITRFGWDKKMEKEFLDLYKSNGGDLNLFEKNRNYWIAFGILNNIKRLVQRNIVINSKTQEKLLRLKKKLLQTMG